MTTAAPQLASPARSPLLLRPTVVCLALVALWAFAYLPALGARDLRLEEGRRATPAWEMLHTGDWLVPRLFGEIYLSKPPLYFWIVAGTKVILGGAHDENATRWHWAVRLPSAIGALLGAFVLLGFARRTLAWPTRILAALAWLATATLLDKGTLGEIDALLSSLVLASLALWYDGFDRDPQAGPTLKGWIASGAVMAAAVLLKGPGGPLEFYSMIGLFLLWQLGLRRTIRILLSPGHLLFIALSIAPAACWIADLLAHTGLTLTGLAHIWGQQAALDEIGIMRPQEPGEGFAWSRYATFLPEVFTMTLPWSIWAIAALFPAVARGAELLPPKGVNAPTSGAVSPAAICIYRFAAAGILGITAIFYLYPGAQSRHMMAVAFPMVLLAALLITAPAARRKLHALTPALRTASGIMCLVPAIAGLVALAASIVMSHAHGLVPMGICIAAVGLALTLLASAANTPTPPLQQTTWTAVTLALTVLAGRAAAAAVFLPAKAPSDITAIDHHQIDQLIDPSLPAYTTNTFATHRGNGYYNILFYVHLRTASTGGLKALPPALIEGVAPPQPTTLPTPCTLLGSPDDVTAVANKLRLAYAPRGDIGVPGRSPPPMVTGVLSLYKDPATQLHPAPATRP